MTKYVCRTCGYVFSAENAEPDYAQITEVGEDMLPEEFECPKCGAPKKDLEAANE